MTNNNKPTSKRKCISKFDIVIANNLKKHRILNGITLKEMSENLDISVQQVQKYESGKNRISASKLHSISKIFKTSIYSFFDEEEELLDTDYKRFLTLFSQIKKTENRDTLLKIMKTLKDIDEC